MLDIDLLKNDQVVLLLEDLNKKIITLYGESLKSIILFGSYARGDNEDESDMDIMILVDLDIEEQRIYRKALVEKITDLSIKYDIIISVIDNNYKEFYKRVDYVPFYKNVANEGVKLYAS